MNLKFCLLNAENLFLLFDQQPSANFKKMEESQWSKLSTSIYPNKELKKILELAKVIEHLDADIIMLVEVGNLESLKNFNSLFLNSKYSEILVEGNSDRNIDVGYLIKKPNSFYFDLLTHKNRDIKLVYKHEINLPAPQFYKFSRDCAELRLFKKDLNHPFLIILLTHLKSPLDPGRIDQHGFTRRSAEVKSCVEIYNELSSEFPTCPIMLCGDFNGNASRNRTEPEFAPIYEKTDLEDILEIAQVDLDKRSTYLQVRPSHKTDGRQIDFCFLSKHLHSLVQKKSAQVYLYKDEFGSDLKLPNSIEQKLELPSDHYPIVFVLENILIS